MAKVRTKFVVSKLSHTLNGAQIELSVVTGGSEENKDFFKYTPSGTLSLGVVKPEHAAQFQPGVEFYVDLTPVNQ